MEKGDFYRQKLSNGVTVLFEKRKLPVVSIIGAVPFGSGYEKQEVKGIAHFVEHMVFKGTKNKNLYQIKEPIEKAGGILNAFTIREETAYWAKLPSKHIEKGMDIIFDMMLNPIFDKVEMEKERKVVLEEMKMYQDNPLSFVYDKIEELLFKKPFGTKIIGMEETLKKIVQKNMFETHNIYCPENMVVAVVGNSDFDKIKELVLKFIPKKQGIKINNPKVEYANGQFIEKRKNIQQASIAFGFHAPSMTEKLRYAAEVFNTALGVGYCSRLYEEIREKRGLAYSAHSYYDHEKSFGEIIARIGTTKEKVKEIKEIVLKEISKLQNIEKKEFEEVKERLIGSFELKNEESDATACSLIAEEFAGNAENHYKYIDFISSVTLDDFKKVGKIKDYSFVALLPE